VLFANGSIGRATVVLGLLLGLAVRASVARADSTGDARSPAPAAKSPAAAPGAAAVGVAVVALPGATDAGWPLARSVYAEGSLRPPSVDERTARALCGEVPAVDASPAVRDLFDTVAALRGDDAPSRALLADLARRLSVRAVLVVVLDAGQPRARAFLPDVGALDAAVYLPDEGATPTAWSAATRSLVRSFGLPSAPLHAPPLATRPVDAAAPRHAFYESAWFWGALGAAAVAGGAVFLATRDSGPSTIHLQLEVPH
jgi:hypothetical protein